MSKTSVSYGPGEVPSYILQTYVEVSNDQGSKMYYMPNGFVCSKAESGTNGVSCVGPYNFTATCTEFKDTSSNILVQTCQVNSSNAKFSKK